MPLKIWFRSTAMILIIVNVMGMRLLAGSRAKIAKVALSFGLASSSLVNTPLPASADVGNLAAAIAAITSNPDSLLCNLDNFNIREGQSSCQQLDNVTMVG